jgi:hypothetical protein
MKWAAELNEPFKDVTYTINVTLADAELAGGSPDCVLYCVLKVKVFYGPWPC